MRDCPGDMFVKPSHHVWIDPLVVDVNHVSRMTVIIGSSGSVGQPCDANTSRHKPATFSIRSGLEFLDFLPVIIFPRFPLVMLGAKGVQDVKRCRAPSILVHPAGRSEGPKVPDPPSTLTPCGNWLSLLSSAALRRGMFRNRSALVPKYPTRSRQ